MSDHATVQELALLMRSGYPLLALVTQEDERAAGMLQEAASLAKRTVVVAAPVSDAAAAAQAVVEASKRNPGTVTVIPDLHYHLRHPEVARGVKRLAELALKDLRCIAVIAPVFDAPAELELEIATVTIPLPSRKEIDAIYGQVAEESPALSREAEVRALFVQAAQGLAAEEARRVFRKAAAAGAGVELVIRDKKRALRRTEGLEFRDLRETLDDIGGMDSLKNWLRERTRAFSADARAFGLPEPRGLFLTGVQGCGKSLVSKAVAGFWRMPLVRLDLAAVFGAPRPEDTLRRALSVAEAMSPCVLWIDEVEKGFDTTEGGSPSRLLGVMVTWLQEKQLPVFAIATANRIDKLPPEFARKGRFDDIFFVDLPQAHERMDIFSLHLKKHGRDPSAFELEKIAKSSERFTGSEIEQAVISALYTAFSHGREVEQADLINAIKETVPLAETFDQEIKTLREWALKRARHASTDRKRFDYFSG